MPTGKDNYPFEPVGTGDPRAPPVAEAVPTAAPDNYYDEEENPSDAAIMVGCGILGWALAGPFLAIVTALGGKYVADRNRGPFGDASRSVGRIAAAAGKKAKEERLLGKFKDSIKSLFD